LDSLRAGVDIVLYSGDKLLGGPQAGIVSGRADLVRRMRSNSLFRALRVDKLTYAVLEATLLAYVKMDYESIPALRMMHLSKDDIARRAQALAVRVARAGMEAVLIDGESVIEEEQRHLRFCLRNFLGSPALASAWMNLRPSCARLRFRSLPVSKTDECCSTCVPCFQNRRRLWRARSPGLDRPGSVRLSISGTVSARPREPRRCNGMILFAMQALVSIRPLRGTLPSQKQLHWSELRVGLTVLFASVTLTVLIFLMSGTTGMFTPKISLRSYFDNASGLRLGAPVRLEAWTSAMSKPFASSGTIA